ncbi:MAG: hypothetical protein AAB633_01650, partial [Patescibacteria group bacterium]
FKKRRAMQAARTVGDRALLAFTTGRILFQEADVDSPLLRYVANPILAAYLWIVKKIVVW